MIQLYSLMWILAVFFAMLGFLRGWNQELIATAGIVLGMFALFQLDAILRGIALLSFPRAQAFLIQIAIFLLIVFFAYQNRTFATTRRRGGNFQEGILGGFVGFLNGYLIGGSLWYFMDINEYPLNPYILAPAADSPSADQLGSIPLIILSGGINGNGDLMVGLVVVLVLIVLMVI